MLVTMRQLMLEPGVLRASGMPLTMDTSGQPCSVCDDDAYEGVPLSHVYVGQVEVRHAMCVRVLPSHM